MRIALVYPPRAYFYMPYLAPWVLQAHLESRGHVVDVVDANIEFYVDAWTSVFALSAAGELHAHGARSAGLRAELLHQHGADAYARLRDPANFTAPAVLHEAAAVLDQADQVIDALGVIRGVPSRTTPAAIGQWPELVRDSHEAPTSRWLDTLVESGRLDGYDLVAMTIAYIGQLVPALTLAAAVKARRPGTPIVVGGGAVTHFLDDIARDPSFFTAVDHVVPYEGEAQFAALVEALEAGAEPPAENIVSCPGDRPIFRRLLSAVPHVEVAPTFRDLDHRYPTPDPVYPLLTSKGCYWGKCTFCTHHEGYGLGYKRFADQTVDAAIANIRARQGRWFYFVDEALPPRKLHGLVEQFGRHQAEGSLHWMAEARLEKALVTEQAVADLTRSGCRLLVNGIESGSKRSLDSMRKGIDLDLVSAHARLCSTAGVRTGWMFFVGQPGETEAESAETFEFIRANADAVDFASVGYFKLQPGSPIWNSPGEFGVSDIRGDAAYPRTLTYTHDGITVHPDALRQRLRALHDRYPDLGVVFAAAVDRALMMFVEPGIDVRGAARAFLAGDVGITFTSSVERREVRYVPALRRFELRPLEAVGAR